MPRAMTEIATSPWPYYCNISPTDHEPASLPYSFASSALQQTQQVFINNSIPWSNLISFMSDNSSVLITGKWSLGLRRRFPLCLTLVMCATWKIFVLSLELRLWPYLLKTSWLKCSSISITVQTRKKNTQSFWNSRTPSQSRFWNTAAPKAQLGEACESFAAPLASLPELFQLPWGYGEAWTGEARCLLSQQPRDAPVLQVHQLHSPA